MRKRQQAEIEFYVARGKAMPGGFAKIRESAYKIQLRFSGGLTPAQKNAFLYAAKRWTKIIIGDLPSVVVDGEVIDDLLILANGVNIDGPGGILGQAGPTHLRPVSAGAYAYLPAKGIMSFDTADLAVMQANGTLEDVITHEMGHVIGIGAISNSKGFVADASTTNPKFAGLNAKKQFGLLRGSRPTPVPLENAEGPGTRYGHWAESVFKNEAMTTGIGTNKRISKVTVGSLKDLGYRVNINAAQPYRLPKRRAVPADPQQAFAHAIPVIAMTLPPDALISPGRNHPDMGVKNRVQNATSARPTISSLAVVPQTDASATPSRSQTPVTSKHSGINVDVQCGDALTIPCDVLVLKYAQALYGVDLAVVKQLEAGGVSLRSSLPKPDMFQLFPTHSTISASFVLFLGVPELWQFEYSAIRQFGSRALSSLSATPNIRRVVLTVHGPNFGLDESESLRAEVAGLLDSLARGECPQHLERITIVENNAGRAERLRNVLQTILPGQPLESKRGSSIPAVLSDTRQALANVGYASKDKPHVFVAMPFAKEFDDRFHYGIQKAAESAGFLCERADLSSFIGDVLKWVLTRIESAAFVVADLSTANPNVYLEIGYAWGHNIPTILLVSDERDLKFDVRTQRCLVYEGSIQRLENLLAAELNSLAAESSHTNR